MEHLFQNHHEYDSNFLCAKNILTAEFFTWAWSQYLGRNPKTAQLQIYFLWVTVQIRVEFKWSFPKSVFHYLSQIKSFVQQSWNFQCCMAVTFSETHPLTIQSKEYHAKLLHHPFLFGLFYFFPPPLSGKLL